MTFFTGMTESDVLMQQLNAKLRRLRGMYVAAFITVVAWTVATPAVFLLLLPHLVLLYSIVIALLLIFAACCWILFAQIEMQAYDRWRQLRVATIQR